MAKRGSKSSKLAAQGGKPSAPAAEITSADRAGKHSKISDELRQAVQALGGDEEDLDLIEGVDDDEEDSPATKSTKPKGKEPSSDEVRFTAIGAKTCLIQQKSLRKALGDFMKGLDFGSVPAPVIDDDDSAEEVSDAESEDDEDEDDEDDDEEDEEEAESDDEDEDEEQGPSEDSDESEEEEERTAVVPPSKQAEVPQSKTKDPVQPLDRDMTSGKVSLPPQMRAKVPDRAPKPIVVSPCSTSFPAGCPSRASATIPVGRPAKQGDQPSGQSPRTQQSFVVVGYRFHLPDSPVRYSSRQAVCFDPFGSRISDPCGQRAV